MNVNIRAELLDFGRQEMESGGHGVEAAAGHGTGGLRGRQSISERRKTCTSSIACASSRLPSNWLPPSTNTLVMPATAQFGPAVPQAGGRIVAGGRPYLAASGAQPLALGRLGTAAHRHQQRHFPRQSAPTGDAMRARPACPARCAGPVRGPGGRAVNSGSSAGPCPGRRRSRPRGRAGRARSAATRRWRSSGWSRCGWRSCRPRSWPTWR